MGSVEVTVEVSGFRRQRAGARRRARGGDYNCGAERLSRRPGRSGGKLLARGPPETSEPLTVRVRTDDGKTRAFPL